MHKEFAAILEHEEALKSLADAIDLILTDRRHDALHRLPVDAIQTTVLVA